jgi:hypothetical protein
MDGTMAVAQRLTVAEFFELPDERWATLVDGEVVVSPPRLEHQRIELAELPGFALALDDLFGARVTPR